MLSESDPGPRAGEGASHWVLDGLLGQLKVCIEGFVSYQGSNELEKEGEYAEKAMVVDCRGTADISGDSSF